MPTENITFDGTEYEVNYAEFVECQHCDYQWDTSSEAERPTCPSCQRKTDREVVGKYYERYMKYSLFNGEETEAEQVISRFQYLADLIEAMSSNGWELHQTTSSSHVIMTKGDFNPGEIVA